MAENEPASTSTKKKAPGANVYEKIHNIQQAVNTVIKGGYNEHFKYSFARERDIVAEVKPLLGKEGLAFTQTLVKEEEVPHGTTSTGSPKFLTKLTFRFRFTNIKDKDDFFEGEGIGSGQDQEDKGVPKAYTMAVKYFFAKTFLIETGDDSEESKKAPKGTKGSTAPAEEKFETAKRMIKGTNNVEGLLEYATKLASGKTFNVAQKKELNDLIKNRIEELEKEAA